MIKYVESINPEAYVNSEILDLWKGEQFWDQRPPGKKLMRR